MTHEDLRQHMQPAKRKTTPIKANLHHRAIYSIPEPERKDEIMGSNTADCESYTYKCFSHIPLLEDTQPTIQQKESCHSEYEATQVDTNHPTVDQPNPSEPQGQPAANRSGGRWSSRKQKVYPRKSFSGAVVQRMELVRPKHEGEVSKEVEILGEVKYGLFKGYVAYNAKNHTVVLISGGMALAHIEIQEHSKDKSISLHTGTDKGEAGGQGYMLAMFPYTLEIVKKHFSNYDKICMNPSMGAATKGLISILGLWLK